MARWQQTRPGEGGAGENHAPNGVRSHVPPRRWTGGSVALALIPLLWSCISTEVRQAAKDAQDLMDAGRWEDAVVAYQEAGNRFPGVATFAAGEGLALAQMKRFDEAEAATRRAIGLEPETASHHLQLGTLFSAQERLDEAADAYGEATRLDPIDPAGWRALGYTEYNRRRYPEARAALEKYLAFAREAEDTLAVSSLVRSLPRGVEE